MTVQLRPYQRQTIDAIKADWNAGYTDVMVTMATGGGKTIVLLQLLDEVLQDGQRAMIIAHRNELIHQPYDRLGQFWPHRQQHTGIVMADRNEAWAQIVIGTVQTLQSEKRLAHVLRSGPIDYLIVDECFPAGTLVDGTPIESIKVGDKVSTWNERTSTFEQGTVTRLFKREAPSRMIRLTLNDSATLCCTPEHPIWVNGAWKPARLIVAGDYLTRKAITDEPYSSQDMRDLRNGLHAAQLEQHNDAALLRAVQGDSAGTAPQGGLPAVRHLRQGSRVRRSNGTGTGTTGTRLLLSGVQSSVYQTVKFGNDDADKQPTCQPTHDRTQPHALAGSKSQNATQDERARLGNRRTGRQWEADATTEGACRRSRMADGSCHSYRTSTQRQRVSHLLQGRYWSSWLKSRRGGGREVSQAGKTQSGRRQEDCAARIVRVDRVEVLERGSDERFGQVCPDGFVYNLEVAGLHTYTANGVAVHNCHHAVASGYQQVVAALRDCNPQLRHLGVTATPIRADEKGLREIYQKESAHFGIKELVKQGYLAPPRWLAIQTGISLADIRSQGSGEERDFNQKQLANVFETANCFDLVVESHRKYADGRQSVAFTVSVDGAYALAETFRNAGIPAAAADGKTAIADRKQLLADFRTGKFQVLCNVALWTEGLDLPEISCVHQVRPTQSDGLYTQMIGRGLRLFPAKQDCIAEGQRVLTDQGLVPIEQVTRAMRVWDGVEFVEHCGAICRGEQEVITYAGLTATPDHKVWTDNRWQRFGECAANGTPIAVTGHGWAAIRETDGYRRHTDLQGQSQEKALHPHALHDVRNRRALESWQCSQGFGRLSQVRAQGSVSARDAASSEVAISPRTDSAAAVHQSQRTQLFTLWRQGHRISIRLTTSNGRVGSGKLGFAQGHGNRPYRQRWALRAGQSALGNTYAECRQQHEGESECGLSRLSVEVSRNPICGCNPARLSLEGNDTGTDLRTVSAGIVQAQRRVWDILNAGPRHRFTVEGLLVSNCLILDYAPVDSRNIAMMGDVLGVEAKKEAYIEKKEEAGEVVAGFTFDGNVKWLQGNPMEIVSRRLDYLSASPWRWAQPQGKSGPMVLGLGKGDDEIERSLVISQPAESMKVWLVAKRPDDRWPQAYEVMTGTFEQCSEWANEYADKRGNAVLVRKQAGWRNQLASDGQITFARRLGVWREGMSKGDCADAITSKLALDAVNRKERQASWGS